MAAADPDTGDPRRRHPHPRRGRPAGPHRRAGPDERAGDGGRRPAACSTGCSRARSLAGVRTLLPRPLAQGAPSQAPARPARRPRPRRARGSSRAASGTSRPTGTSTPTRCRPASPPTHGWAGGVIERPAWRPVTRYERRALRDGRTITDLDVPNRRRVRSASHRCENARMTSIHDRSPVAYPPARHAPASVVSPLCLGGNVFGWTADRDQSFDVLDAYAAAAATSSTRPTCTREWVPGNTRRRVRDDHRRVAGGPRQPRRDDHRHEGRQACPAAAACRRANIRGRASTASLRRLRTDHIDLYYAHEDDPGRSDRGDPRRPSTSWSGRARCGTSPHRTSPPTACASPSRSPQPTASPPTSPSRTTTT